MSEVIHVTELPNLPPRHRDGHKGAYGRVSIVAGSRGMAGAAGLAGMAALRGGAGLVTVTCPQEVASIIAGYEPAYLTRSLPSDQEGKFAAEAIDLVLETRADVVALGPGLGQSQTLGELVAHLVSKAKVPLVIDADGLNLLVGRLELLRSRRPSPSQGKKSGPKGTTTVLTPHLGEFSRLTGSEIEEIQKDREGRAAAFALQHNVILVLKGSGSIITDGEQLAINRTGNPGMATGGSGDVLTGLLASLIGQGMTPFDAAHLAVHLHGLAGDLVAQRGSEVSLIAGDLARALPLAFRSFEQGEPI